MKPGSLLICMVAVATGCTASGGSGALRGMGTLVPGYGVAPEAVTAHCESQQHFAARVAHYEEVMKQRADQSPYGVVEVADIPQVGQDACEVLAMLGAPNEQNVHRSASGESYTWWYRTRQPSQNAEPHIVRMEYDAERVLRVATVTW